MRKIKRILIASGLLGFLSFGITQCFNINNIPIDASRNKTKFSDSISRAHTTITTLTPPPPQSKFIDAPARSFWEALENWNQDLSKNELSRIQFKVAVEGPRPEGGSDYCKTIVIVKPTDDELKSFEERVGVIRSQYVMVNSEIMQKAIEDLRNRFMNYKADYKIYNFRERIIYSDGTSGTDSLNILEGNKVEEVERDGGYKDYIVGGSFMGSKTLSSATEINKYKELKTLPVNNP